MNQNNNLGRDPNNEEMKLPDANDANRLLLDEAVRRELTRLNEQRNAVPPQHLLGAGNQVDYASRLAMEQAFLSAQQRGITSRTSNFLGGLHQHQPSNATAALGDLGAIVGGSGLSAHGLPNNTNSSSGGVSSHHNQLRMLGGDSRHQLQFENLMLQQQLQQQPRASALWNTVLSPTTSAVLSNTQLSNSSILSPSSNNMAFRLDGSQAIHSHPGAMLEGRIGARSVAASERKDEEEKVASSSRPGQGGGEPDGEDNEDGSTSDREEDALDDDAFYVKRNSVETVEDLHLQNETFPMKLYRMLYEVAKNGKEDIVSFLPHGRAFAIHKQNEFSTILPEYFATDRMASFQRQLNLYGFRRITTEGKDKGAFFHEKFIHGKRSLCKKIKRKRGSRKSSSNLRRSSETMPSSSLSSQQTLIQQQSNPGSRLSANAWGRSIAAGQGSVAGSLSLAGLGSSLGSGADLLGIGGTAGRPLSAAASSSMLLQQQQLQRLRQQQDLEQRLMLERERARRGHQQP